MTTSNNSSANWQTIQATFRKDEISQYIINDETLFAWGNYLTIKMGLPQAKHIRDKLRTVATFCKSYHRDYGTDDISVRQICQTKNFEKMFATAQQSFGSALTPPVKLGKYIKDLMIIIKQQAIYRNDVDRQQEIERFLFLVDTSWNIISAPNIRTLKELKPVVVEMPITADIKNLIQFLSSEIEKHVQELNQNPNLETWLSLSKSVLVFLIVFNRRREGEVSRIKLETYTNKPNYDAMETDTLLQTLTDIEKYLCKNYSYFTTVGKRNRRVPILYPQSIEVALNCLVQKRQICGILQENQFLFANTTLNFIRGGDAIRSLVEQCCLTYNLQKPHLIKSTQ